MFSLIFRIERSYWLLAFPLLHMTVPWVQYRCRAIVPFFFIVCWLVVMYLQPNRHFLPPRVRRVLAKKYLALLVWYFLMWFMQNIYWCFGHSILMPYYQLAAVLANGVYIVVLYFSIATGRIRELKFLMFVALVGYLLSGVSSFAGLRAGLTEAARTGMLVGKGEVDHTMFLDAVEGYELGLANYGFTYIAACMVGPLLFAAMKVCSKQVKVLSIFAAIGCLITVRISGLGTPLFVAVFGICTFLLSFVIRNYRVLGLIISMTFLLFFIFQAQPQAFSFLSNPLLAVADRMESGSIEQRVRSLAMSFKGDQDTYARQRFETQWRSIKAFSDHPVFGLGHNHFWHPQAWKIGGHSYIFDKLGQEGLVGFIPVVFYYLSLFGFMVELSKRVLGKTWLPMLTMFIFSYIFASIANPLTALPATTYILFPGLALYFKDSPFNSERRIRMRR